MAAVNVHNTTSIQSERSAEALRVSNDDNTATPRNTLVKITGSDGANHKVSKSGYGDPVSAVCQSALAAESATARYQDKAAERGLAQRWVLLTDQDTSERAVGDLAYQSADGEFAFAAISGSPVGAPVGEVLTVDDSTGHVMLDPDRYRWRKHREVTVRIPTASVLTMNATPVTVVPAPGAGKINVVESVRVTLAYASAAYACDAGEDLQFRYTDGSGTLVVATIDDLVFAGVTDNKVVIRRGIDAVLTENAAIVAYIATGEWATGDSDLIVTVKYEVVGEVEE